MPLNSALENGGRDEEIKGETLDEVGLTPEFESLLDTLRISLGNIDQQDDISHVVLRHCY